MKYHRILAGVSVGTLLGCSSLSTSMAPADPGRSNAVAGHAQPSRLSAGSVTDLDALYRQGRAAQDAGQSSRAEALYGRILVVAPAHEEALNALGVLHARSGRLEQALALFERAVALAPRSVTPRSNRGYALLLLGRLDEAQRELEMAHMLDTSNPAARANLAQAEEALARRRAAAQPTAQPTGPDPAPAVQLVAVAPQVYELRDATPAAHNPLAGVRLEVSNGVGIRHLARHTARELAASWGLVPTRLSNQRGFRQPRTVVEYGAGQLDLAQALAARLPATPPVSAARMAPPVQLRLVLGHDAAGRAIAAWIENATPTLAARDEAAGWLLG